MSSCDNNASESNHTVASKLISNDNYEDLKETLTTIEAINKNDTENLRKNSILNDIFTSTINTTGADGDNVSTLARPQRFATGGDMLPKPAHVAAKTTSEATDSPQTRRASDVNKTAANQTKTVDLKESITAGDVFELCGHVQPMVDEIATTNKPNTLVAVTITTTSTLKTEPSSPSSHISDQNLPHIASEPTFGIALRRNQQQQQQIFRSCHDAKHKGTISTSSTDDIATSSSGIRAGSMSALVSPSMVRKSSDISILMPRRVSFPKSDNELVTGYLEPANPWEYVYMVKSISEIAELYVMSCQKHNTKPLQTILDHLKGVELSKTLRQPLLSLKSIKMEPSDCEALEEVFKRVQYKTIDLSSCELTESAAMALFEMIEYYEAANELDISSNADGMTHRGWTSCTYMVSHSRALQVLNAQGNPISRTGAENLGHALTTSNIHTIKLEHCGLKGPPLSGLCFKLRHNRVLRELWLAHNDLDCEDAESIAKLLTVNHYLQLVDISNNNIRDEGLKKIVAALISQSREVEKRSLLQRTTAIDDDDCTVIEKNSGSTHGMHYDDVSNIKDGDGGSIDSDASQSEDTDDEAFDNKKSKNTSKQNSSPTEEVAFPNTEVAATIATTSLLTEDLDVDEEDTEETVKSTPTATPKNSTQSSAIGGQSMLDKLLSMNSTESSSSDDGASNLSTDTLAACCSEDVSPISDDIFDRDIAAATVTINSGTNSNALTRAMQASTPTSTVNDTMSSVVTTCSDSSDIKNRETDPATTIKENNIIITSSISNSNRNNINHNINQHHQKPQEIDRSLLTSSCVFEVTAEETDCLISTSVTRALDVNKSATKLVDDFDDTHSTDSAFESASEGDISRHLPEEFSRLSTSLDSSRLDDVATSKGFAGVETATIATESTECLVTAAANAPSLTILVEAELLKLPAQINSPPPSANINTPPKAISVGATFPPVVISVEERCDNSISGDECSPLPLTASAKVTISESAVILNNSKLSDVTSPRPVEERSDNSISGDEYSPLPLSAPAKVTISERVLFLNKSKLSDVASLRSVEERSDSSISGDECSPLPLSASAKVTISESALFLNKSKLSDVASPRPMEERSDNSISGDDCSSLPLSSPAKVTISENALFLKKSKLSDVASPRPVEERSDNSVSEDESSPLPLSAPAKVTISESAMFLNKSKLSDVATPRPTPPPPSTSPGGASLGLRRTESSCAFITSATRNRSQSSDSLCSDTSLDGSLSSDINYSTSTQFNENLAKNDTLTRQQRNFEAPTEANSKAPCGLKALALWNNNLTKESGHYIAELLAETASLELLNIGKNCLSNEFVSTIKDSLMRNTTLTTLGLQSAHLSAKGIETLSSILTFGGNCSLQRIDIRDNKLEVESLTTLAEVLKSNTTVTQIDIDDEPKRLSVANDAHLDYARVLQNVRSMCSRNEKSAQSQLQSADKSMTNVTGRRRGGYYLGSRKISLTCQTRPAVVENPPNSSTVSSSIASNSKLDIKRKTGARLRSPIPSPPTASPSSSPSRSRFKVFRVSEVSPLTSPISTTAPVVTTSSCVPIPTTSAANYPQKVQSISLPNASSMSLLAGVTSSTQSIKRYSASPRSRFQVLKIYEDPRVPLANRSLPPLNTPLTPPMKSSGTTMSSSPSILHTVLSASVMAAEATTNTIVPVTVEVAPKKLSHTLNLESTKSTMNANTKAAYNNTNNTTQNQTTLSPILSASSSSSSSSSSSTSPASMSSSSSIITASSSSSSASISPTPLFISSSSSDNADSAPALLGGVVVASECSPIAVFEENDVTLTNSSINNVLTMSSDLADDSISASQVSDPKTVQQQPLQTRVRKTSWLGNPAAVDKLLTLFHNPGTIFQRSSSPDTNLNLTALPSAVTAPTEDSHPTVQQKSLVPTRKSSPPTWSQLGNEMMRPVTSALHQSNSGETNAAVSLSTTAEQSISFLDAASKQICDFSKQVFRQNLAFSNETNSVATIGSATGSIVGVLSNVVAGTITSDSLSEQHDVAHIPSDVQLEIKENISPEHTITNETLQSLQKLCIAAGSGGVGFGAANFIASTSGTTFEESVSDECSGEESKEQQILTVKSSSSSSTLLPTASNISSSNSSGQREDPHSAMPQTT